MVTTGLPIVRLSRMPVEVVDQFAKIAAPFERVEQGQFSVVVAQAEPLFGSGENLMREVSK